MKNSLLLVLSLVFISGCVGQTAKVDINNGVVIERFVADPVDVFDYQAVTFSGDISNLGGTTAENAEVKLLGVEGAWRQSSGTGLIGEVKKAFGTLKPPLLKDNIPGDSRFFTFILSAPNLNEGDRATFPVKARVEFTYATTGSTILKGISLNQQQILSRRGEAPPQTAAESNSDGPVKFNFVRGAVPLIIDPDEGATIDREFRFEISNVGRGWPLTNNEVGKVGGRIQLRGPSSVSLKGCEGFSSGDKNSFSAVLRSDGKAPISCTLQINTADWRTRTEESIIFDVQLTYKYFVEQEASVTIQGTKRDDLARATPPAGATPTPVPGTTPGAGVAPTVLTTSPVAGSTTADLRPTVIITFSKSIDANSITNSITLTGPDGTVSGTTGIGGASGENVAFTPAPALRLDSTYTVIVSTSIKSRDGFNLANQFTFTFKTPASDTTAPTVGLVSPALDSIVNTRTVTLRVSTNEAAVCRILATGELFTPSADGRTHSLNQIDLTDGQKIFVVRCKDAANNEAAANDLTIRFRVDATAPSVLGTDPANAATGVSRNKQIAITFNEEMDESSTESAFSIAPSVTGTKTWNAARTQLFFTPSANMAATTEHTVTISTGAKDKAGNPLASATTFKFTTAA